MTGRDLLARLTELERHAPGALELPVAVTTCNTPSGERVDAWGDELLVTAQDARLRRKGVR